MIVPTPDKQFLDLSTGFTESGSPTFTADQHNSGNVALSADGVDDRLNRIGIHQSGDIQLTWSFWTKLGVQGSDSWHLSQLDSSGLQGVFINLTAAGELRMAARNSIGARTISSTFIVIDDDIFHLVTVTVNGNTGSTDADIRIFIDGPEVSSYNFFNDHAGGTGFASITASAASQQFSIASGQHFGRFIQGIISRVKVWRVALSPVQVQKEFNNEFASIGEGFAKRSKAFTLLFDS